MQIAEFSNSFAELPERFYVRQTPAIVADPQLIKFNDSLARELGLNLAAVNAADTAAIFSGNLIPAGADPIAMAYAGHQFGNFVPQLGDGRAILLGEVIDHHGIRRDIQLKGAGRTAFSRGGDGRAALGPVLREYLISESMHALGIPTTRALAAVTTRESVVREQLLPGAVFTRIAASNIRVGTFQYFAARGDQEGVKTLADYAINRHYPQLRDHPDPYLALLATVAEKQAALIAAWLQIGFIHGVMNTDNMTISGETIDYGPCAFMDTYDPATVFSSIDVYGRYAYGNQPSIALWNLTRLAETLLPLIDPVEARSIERATEVLQEFSPKFQAFHLAGMRRKLGLQTVEEADSALIQSLTTLMHENKADFSLLFRRLGDQPDARDLFENPASFDIWHASWQERLSHEPTDPEARTTAMRTVNPAFIPRNHNVEAALAAAVAQADFQPFNDLLEVLQHPYTDQPNNARYAKPPLPSATPFRTFCGT